MKSFHALLHDCRLDGETGYAATCAEIPNAVGEGETVEECLADLRRCIEFIFETNRQTAISASKDEMRELIFA